MTFVSGLYNPPNQLFIYDQKKSSHPKVTGFKNSVGSTELFCSAIRSINRQEDKQVS